MKRGGTEMAGCSYAAREAGGRFTTTPKSLICEEDLYAVEAGVSAPNEPQYSQYARTRAENSRMSWQTAGSKTPPNFNH